MSDYKLALKQIVAYPRCRIYRQFIRELMKDRNIRISGCSGLFYYTVLCSFANFRTSYRNIEGTSYTIYPGEWICRVDEIDQLWIDGADTAQIIKRREENPQQAKAQQQPD